MVGAGALPGARRSAERVGVAAICVQIVPAGRINLF